MVDCAEVSLQASAQHVLLQPRHPGIGRLKCKPAINVAVRLSILSVAQRNVQMS